MISFNLISRRILKLLHKYSNKHNVKEVGFSSICAFLVFDIFRRGVILFEIINLYLFIPKVEI